MTQRSRFYKLTKYPAYPVAVRRCSRSHRTQDAALAPAASNSRSRSRPRDGIQESIQAKVPPSRQLINEARGCVANGHFFSPGRLSFVVPSSSPSNCGKSCCTRLPGLGGRLELWVSIFEQLHESREPDSRPVAKVQSGPKSIVNAGVGDDYVTRTGPHHPPPRLFLREPADRARRTSAQLIHAGAES